jgi:3',5'-cyclic AMP phosphodiesterase CpdA
MLRIGDIHISKKNVTNLVDALRTYIAAHPDEQHIVFVGDYVYHFQYERAALLALYQLFLDLYIAGKHVYVLAGNHDWIHNYFVYEEGKRSFDTAQDSTATHQ